MAQMFPAWSNFAARAALLFLVFAGLALPFFLGAFVQSSYSTGVGQLVTQPIQFSHKHHVQGLGLDCRFCHSSAYVSASAGYPDTWTCMGCHSQIWTQAPILQPVRDSLKNGTPLAWNRVYEIPDHAYFNHSIHVGKGLDCRTCHGEVGQMPAILQIRSFRMKDCVNCHEKPTAYGVAPEVVEKNSIKLQSIRDCYTCHR